MIQERDEAILEAVRRLASEGCRVVTWTEIMEKLKEMGKEMSDSRLSRGLKSLVNQGQLLHIGRYYALPKYRRELEEKVREELEITKSTAILPSEAHHKILVEHSRSLVPAFDVLVLELRGGLAYCRALTSLKARCKRLFDVRKRLGIGLDIPIEVEVRDYELAVPLLQHLHTGYRDLFELFREVRELQGVITWLDLSGGVIEIRGEATAISGRLSEIRQQLLDYMMSELPEFRPGVYPDRIPERTAYDWNIASDFDLYDPFIQRREPYLKFRMCCRILYEVIQHVRQNPETTRIPVEYEKKTLGRLVVGSLSLTVGLRLAEAVVSLVNDEHFMVMARNLAELENKTLEKQKNATRRLRMLRGLVIAGHPLKGTCDACKGITG